jgi:hypothetical protein
MPVVTVNPPAAINVRVGGDTKPRVSTLSVTAAGGNRLKESTDLAFVDVSDGDIIVYQANTNSFIMESIGESINSISLIGNVDTTTLVNGSVLVYKSSTQKWVSTTTLEEQNLEGGHY